MNYFPFSKNVKKELINMISDSDIKFKDTAPGSDKIAQELSRTTDRFGVKDPEKRTTYINFKKDLMGSTVR